MLGVISPFELIHCASLVILSDPQLLQNLLPIPTEFNWNNMAKMQSVSGVHSSLNVYQELLHLPGVAAVFFVG